MIIYIAKKHYKKKFLKEFYPIINECIDNVNLYSKVTNNKFTTFISTFKDLDNIEREYFEIVENNIKSIPLFIFLFLLLIFIILMPTLWTGDTNFTSILRVGFSILMFSPLLFFLTIIMYCMMPVEYDFNFSYKLDFVRGDLNRIRKEVKENMNRQHILIEKEIKPYNILEYEYNLKKIIENNKKVKEELIKASKNDYIIYTALKTMNIIEDINK